MKVLVESSNKLTLKDIVTTDNTPKFSEWFDPSIIIRAEAYKQQKRFEDQLNELKIEMKDLKLKEDNPRLYAVMQRIKERKKKISNSK